MEKTTEGSHPRGTHWEMGNWFLHKPLGKNTVWWLISLASLLNASQDQTSSISWRSKTFSWNRRTFFSREECERQRTLPQQCCEGIVQSLGGTADLKVSHMFRCDQIIFCRNDAGTRTERMKKCKGSKLNLKKMECFMQIYFNTLLSCELSFWYNGSQMGSGENIIKLLDGWMTAITVTSWRCWGSCSRAECLQTSIAQAHIVRKKAG